MEERVIIKSSQRNLKPVFYVIYCIAFLAIIVGVLMYHFNFDGNKYYYTYKGALTQRSIWTYMEVPYNFMPGMIIDIGIIMAVVCFLTFLCFKSYCVIVTDKRVYGYTSWNRRVDLPIDCITSIERTALSGIAINTSNRKIPFNFIKNKEEVYEEIAEIISDKKNIFKDLHN